MVRGDIRALLSGEPVALNYLQRMSGIATYTRSIASLLRGSRTKLLDTGKPPRICGYLKNMPSRWAAATTTGITFLTEFS